MSATPEVVVGPVKALLHSIHDQPDADAVRAPAVDAATEEMTNEAAIHAITS